MALRELGPGLWCVDHELQQGPGMSIGARTTVVRLSSGDVWVHSPGPLDASDVDAIRAIGPVRALVAPNLLHHLFLGDAQRAFPDAATYAVAGLSEKRKDLRIDHVLTEPSPWDDLDLVLADGVPSIAEAVFLHRPSRTLILVDLAFHVRRGSFATRALMTVNGAWDRFGPSRVFRYAILKDAAALRRTLDRVLAWDFDRVVVAHGDVLDTGGRTAMREAFAWVR